MKRRLLVAGAAVLAVLIGLGVAYYIHIKNASHDIRGSSTVEFVPTTPPPPAVPVPTEPGVSWPMYGRDPQRLRFANGVALAPPFHRIWTFHARDLVEFPPAVAYGRLYFANNSGVLFAISAKTGKRAWMYVSHRCQAMSPAVDGHTIYATFLNKPPCNANGKGRHGELVALWAGSGKVRWRKRIGPSESSPLVDRHTVYVGDWDGNVSAFAAGSGRRWWTFRADGQVKGGLAIAGGRVYFGDYASHVYALDAGTGKLVWKATAQPRFGSMGTFYATPAIAYDRVYIGSTDGKMYSFGATTGKIRWSQSTGNYLYASAAVWRRRVYAGSYDGNFYCFDAATGDVKWKFNAQGRISGSPTVIAGRVYFATLKGKTFALNARNGHVLWSFPDGKYSPVVADDKRVYLVGYAKVYGLVESRPLRSSGHAVHGHGSSRVHRVSPRRSAHRGGK